MNLAERVSIESKLLPRIMWEQEVNSKKKKKKKKKNPYKNWSTYQMYSKMHFKYYCWINFGECYCLKYSGDNISRICLEFEKIPSIKLSSLTSWYRRISNQRVNHQIFRIVGPCGSCEDVIFLQCPSQSSLFCHKEGCRYLYERRRKALGQRMVFRDKRRSFC